jgi:hypothetical protein
MAEAGLVLLETVVVVDLLVAVLALVYDGLVSKAQCIDHCEQDAPQKPIVNV